jgi:fructose-bisphosphate aldolase class I
VHGFKSSEKVTTEEIAKKTLDCLKKNVPSDVPGVAFLSGGQSEQDATNNLDAINKINDTNFLITFSYGRALQQSALKTWSKEMSNTKAIHDIFNHRAKMNGLASRGEWSKALEI